MTLSLLVLVALFMATFAVRFADEPAVPPPAPPPEPAPAAPAPVTPAPVAAPVEPQTPDPAVAGDTLDLATPFQIPLSDGTIAEATVEDMANAYRKQVAAQPDPGAADLIAKKAELMDKAAQGDAAASQELLTMYAPPKPEVPVDPRDEQLAELQKEFTALKESMQGAIGTSDRIQEAQRINVHRNVIDQYKDKIPFLAKDPVQGARMVEQQMAQVRAAATQTYGLTEEQFNNHPNFSQVYTQAIASVENACRAQAERWKDFAPPVAGATPTPGTEVVNDQNTPAPNQGGARIQVNAAGQLVNAAGQPVAQDVTGKLVALPTAPLSTQPAGGAVGTETTPATPAGPFTVDSMKDAMRRRVQEDIAQ